MNASGTHPSIDVDSARPIVEAVFAEYAHRLRLPSIAWGVVADGQLVLGENEAAIYRIASMTKSFTCAALLILRDEGRLLLDDPITDHAREFSELGVPTTDSPPITIRHLMTMSSGLATDDAWADRHLDMTDVQLDDIVAGGLNFAAAPGTTFEYSNLGFAILGRVVRNITRATVQRLISDRLLSPLGMGDTTWTEPVGAVPGYRQGGDDPHEALIVEPSLGDGVMSPMGGLFSSVSDLAKWMHFLTSAFPAGDAGNTADAPPLSPSSRREMQQMWRAFQPRVTVGSPDRRQRVGGYGYGLNVVPHVRLGTVVYHSGGLPGFGSNMRWAPEAGVGLIALSNSTYAPMTETTSAALDALCAGGAITVPATKTSAAVARTAAALVELLNSWDDGLASSLFADNMDLDQDRVSRRSEASELCADHGPFTMARIFAESATSAIVIAHGTSVELQIDFQLTPTNPPLVQYYGTTVVK